MQDRLPRVACARRAPRASICASSSMTGPTSVDSRTGSPTDSSCHVARPAGPRRDRRCPAAGTAARSAEQRCPALLNAECTLSWTTCSGSAELSTNIAFCPPVSAMRTPIGPSRPARARLISRAVSVEPVNATPADARIRHRAAADRGAVARQEMQHVRRHTRFEHELDRAKRDQRRLFRRLGEHGIAGRECRGDLAGEDRQREIPRTDADEHAAAAQTEGVALARGSRQHARLAEVLDRYAPRSNA